MSIDDGTASDSTIAARIRSFGGYLGLERLRPWPLLVGLLLVALVTALGEIASQYISTTHVALLYLLAVLVVAVCGGLWPALTAAVAGVAALDFFFVPPIYSFLVNTPQDALTLVCFATVAIMASSLAAQLREQMLLARRHAAMNSELYRFAGHLAATIDLDAVEAAAAAQIGAMLGCRATISLKDDTASAPSDLSLPLRAAGQTVGKMTVCRPVGRGLSAEELHLLDALAELTGIAVGRQVLAAQLEKLAIEREADRLRSALLNSVAHDLTGPISAIASVLTSLRGGYERFGDSERRDLIADAAGEAERLHRFAANLVRMTQLEEGSLRLHHESVEVGDLIGSALGRARDILGPRRVIVETQPGLPQPEVDFVLMEQAIFNILENAGKYTPPDAVVTITVEPIASGVSLSIADTGPGLVGESGEQVFDKFYRASTIAGDQIAGMGLGLAICRAFIEAHEGKVTAANRPEGGAVFKIVLPV